MKKFKKFTTKAMIKALKNEINEMSNDDAYVMVKGTYLLFTAMKKFMDNRIGSEKRMSDLFEYMTILHSAYLKKDA